MDSHYYNRKLAQLDLQIKIAESWLMYKPDSSFERWRMVSTMLLDALSEKQELKNKYYKMQNNYANKQPKY